MKIDKDKCPPRRGPGSACLTPGIVTVVLRIEQETGELGPSCGWAGLGSGAQAPAEEGGLVCFLPTCPAAFPRHLDFFLGACYIPPALNSFSRPGDSRRVKVPNTRDCGTSTVFIMLLPRSFIRATREGGLATPREAGSVWATPSSGAGSWLPFSPL